MSWPVGASLGEPNKPVTDWYRIHSKLVYEGFTYGPCKKWRYGITYLAILGALLPRKNEVIREGLQSSRLPQRKPPHSLDNTFSRFFPAKEAGVVIEQDTVAINYMCTIAPG